MDFTFGTNIKFTLTDDIMNTKIEDTNVKDKLCFVFLNNLAICSLVERGYQFCHEFAGQTKKGMIALEAAAFNLRARFYTNETIILVQNGMEVKVTLNLLKTYYEQVLCRIIIDKKMEDSTGFADNYLDEMKEMKEEGKKYHKDRKKTNK